VLYMLAGVVGFRVVAQVLKMVGAGQTELVSLSVWFFQKNVLLSSVVCTCVGVIVTRTNNCTGPEMMRRRLKMSGTEEKSSWV